MFEPLVTNFIIIFMLFLSFDKKIVRSWKAQKPSLVGIKFKITIQYWVGCWWQVGSIVIWLSSRLHAPRTTRFSCHSTTQKIKHPSVQKLRLRHYWCWICRMHSHQRISGLMFFSWKQVVGIGIHWFTFQRVSSEPDLSPSTTRKKQN